MNKKWVMRLIDDVSIPHWIIEEEVKELPNTRKRVGFCDSQEDAELIIAAPKLQVTVDRQRELLERCDAHYRHSGGCPWCGLIGGMIFENVYRHRADCELAKELADE